MKEKAYLPDLNSQLLAAHAYVLKICLPRLEICRIVFLGYGCCRMAPMSHSNPIVECLPP